jgi:predicted TIM-barrel fold metal-dependent hydrolase
MREEPNQVIDACAALGSGETRESKTRHVRYDADELLRYSSEAGITRSCIMPARNLSYEEKNREIARFCEKYPGKFIGFAVHSPQRETGRLREVLIREVRSMGLKALKTDGHPTREILDVAAELGVPVMYYPEEETASLTRLYDTMLAVYPSVSFILPHLGSYRSARWWVHIEAIDLAKRYPNFYLETSGVLSHKYLEMATRVLPAERIIFGSNAPELDPRVEVYAVKLLKLTGEQEAAVFGGNIRRLLGLSVSGPEPRVS